MSITKESLNKAINDALTGHKRAAEEWENEIYGMLCMCMPEFPIPPETSATIYTSWLIPWATIPLTFDNRARVLKWAKSSGFDVQEDLTGARYNIMLQHKDHIVMEIYMYEHDGADCEIHGIGKASAREEVRHEAYEITCKMKE